MNLPAVVAALRRPRSPRSSCSGTGGVRQRPGDPRRDVRGHRARDHGRLPPPAHPPLLPVAQAGGVRVRGARLDGGAGPGDQPGWPTTASTTRTPTRRATRTARTSGTATGRRGVSAASGTPTRAGCCPTRARPSKQVRAGPLRGPRACALINRRFPLIVLAGLAAAGARRVRAHGGTLAGAATGLLWGGLVRIFLVHHVTWSVNSVCHFLGTRRFETDDESPTCSGSRCPRSASPGTTTTTPSRAPPSTGCGAGRLDPSALVIRGLERVGLARNVVRIAPERQQQRETDGARRAGRAETPSVPAGLLASLTRVASSPARFSSPNAQAIWVS